MYVDRQFVVPPGSQTKIKSYGLMTLSIINIIMAKSHLSQHLSFRICLWGSSTPQLFLATPSGQLKATFRIVTSQQLLMKYLSDMGTLVIQAFDSRNTKKVGSVFVNLKRFQTLNSRQQQTVSSFTQKFDIASAAKQKIGQISLSFDIDMHTVLQPEVRNQVYTQVPNTTLQPSQQPNVIIPNQLTLPLAKKHKQNQTDFQLEKPTSPKILNYSLTLQIMKLQQDEALLFGDTSPSSTSHTSSQFIELSLEIANVKFQQRTLKPIERITIVYPNQPDREKPLTNITTILNSLKSSASSCTFNQSIVIKAPSAEHTVEIFCGDGVASYPLKKLLDADGSDLRLFLSKKDNSRYCQVLCRPKIKQSQKEFNLLLYVGQYCFNEVGDYLLKLNSKSKDIKTLKPLNQRKYYCKLLYEKVCNPEVIVVEVWRKEQHRQVVYGLVRMDIHEGIEDRRWTVKAVSGQEVGWIRIILRLGSTDQVSLFSEELDRRIRGGSIDYQDVIGGSSKPIEVVNPTGPAAQPKPMPQPVPTTVSDSHQCSFLELYIKILQDMKKCREPACKKLTDSFLSRPTISKQQFVSLLQLSTKQPLNSFLARFDFPLPFDSFMNSYLRYTHYQRKIRVSLQQLLNSIHKSVDTNNIKINKLTSCFGYIQSAQLTDLLIASGVSKQHSWQLCKYLYANHKKQIFLDDLVQILKGAKDTVGCFALCQFTLAQLMKLYTLQQLEEEVHKFTQGQGMLTHFEDCVLDKLVADAQLQLMDQYQPHNHTVPDVPVVPEVVPVAPVVPSIVPPSPPIPPTPPKKKMELTIHSLECDIEGLTDIIVNSDICLHSSELPKSVLLPEGQEITIRIHMKQGMTLEGYFVVQPTLRKTKLYCRNKQVGTVYFGQAQDRQILVEVTKKPSGKQPNIVGEMRQIEPEEPAVSMRYMTAQLINIQFLSIVPSTTYQITSQSFQLKYPVQYQVTTHNTRQHPITMQVSNTSSGTCVVHVTQGITKYVINKPDGSLLCILQLRITPQYTQPKIVNAKKCVFAYLQRIDDFGNHVPAQFTLLVDCNGQISKSKKINKKSISAMVDLTLTLSQCDKYRIEVVGSAVQFQFVVQYHSELGMFRHQGYLRSHNCRLSLIVYEVNYNDDFSKMKNGQQKMQKIWRLFTPEGLKLLSRENSEQVLLNQFKFTYSQLNVFQSLNRHIVINNHLTGHLAAYNTSLSLQQLHQQYSLYDFESVGQIKKDKAQLVYSLITNDGSQLQDTFPTSLDIVDLNASDKVDYYYMLRQYEMANTADRYFWQKDAPKDEPPKQNIAANKYVRVSIIRYEDLVVRGMPGTYVFQLDGLNIAEPIPRCYSHKFSEPYPAVVVRYPCRVKVLNKEYGMVELWKYVEVADVALQECTHVLNGMVYFRIEEVTGHSGAAVIAPNSIGQNSGSKMTPEPTMEPRKMRVPNSFPSITPIKQEGRRGGVKREEQDPGRKSQLDKFKRIMNQSIDLSKYNFDDSDDD